MEMFFSKMHPKFQKFKCCRMLRHKICTPLTIIYWLRAWRQGGNQFQQQKGYKEAQEPIVGATQMRKWDSRKRVLAYCRKAQKQCDQ